MRRNFSVELITDAFWPFGQFCKRMFLKVKKNLDERWNLQQRLEMAERVAAENVEKANHVNRKFELEQAGKINQTGTSVVIV